MNASTDRLPLPTHSGTPSSSLGRFSLSLSLRALPLIVSLLGAAQTGCNTQAIDVGFFGNKEDLTADGTCESIFSCISGNPTIVAPTQADFSPDWENGYATCALEKNTDKLAKFTDGACEPAHCADEEDSYVVTCDIDDDCHPQNCRCGCLPLSLTGFERTP